MSILDQLTKASNQPFVRKDRAGRVVKDIPHMFLEGSNPHLLYKLLSAHPPTKNWNSGEIAVALTWTENEAKSAIRHLRTHGYLEDVGTAGRYKLYRLRKKEEK